MVLSLGQRTQRVVRLLTGLSYPEVAGPMCRYGLKRADVDRGWDLLRAATPFAPPPAERKLPDVIAELEAFEKEWFPIVRFTLEGNHPEIAERFFNGIGQTSGRLVILSVGAFLDRVALLSKGERPFGPDGPGVRALLAVRGLTPEMVGQAQALLDGMGTFADVDAPPVVDTSAAEEAMWSWYREWSRIARHAITDRRWLYRLGVVTRRARKAED